jgi:hypothetical protein
MVSNHVSGRLAFYPPFTLRFHIIIMLGPSSHRSSNEESVLYNAFILVSVLNPRCLGSQLLTVDTTKPAFELLASMMNGNMSIMYYTVNFLYRTLIKRSGKLVSTLRMLLHMSVT